MDIRENVDLSAYSTMRLGGQARHLAEAKSESRLKELADWSASHNLPLIVIGQGSNIVWLDEGFNGLVVVNQIAGIKTLLEDSKNLVVQAGSGEIWDRVVEWSINKNLSGLEFLSRIPGLAGAAPVQNIGAYGAELSSILVELEAYDNQAKKFVNIKNRDCGFAYRTSRFKTTDKGRFLITSISLRLSKSKPEPPFYESLQNYLDDYKVDEYTPKTIRDAVSEIRKVKLPDPSVVANNGSFFTNPIIAKSEFNKLKRKYPDIKGWPRDDGKVKLSAGWMIEQAGFKDYHDKSTGMGTWWGSALVMINEHAHLTADLLTFKQKIVSKVHDMFGIVLEQEPELLP